MTDFYTNFVQQCSKKGVSPSAAAEAVGLSRSAPVGWKKGAMPRDTAINMLADYFGCSVSDLTSRTKLTLGGKSDFKSTDDINDSVLSNLPQREQMRQEMRILCCQHGIKKEAPLAESFKQKGRNMKKG